MSSPSRCVGVDLALLDGSGGARVSSLRDAARQVRSARDEDPGCTSWGLKAPPVPSCAFLDVGHNL